MHKALDAAPQTQIHSIAIHYFVHMVMERVFSMKTELF